MNLHTSRETQLKHILETKETCCSLQNEIWNRKMQNIENEPGITNYTSI